MPCDETLKMILHLDGTYYSGNGSRHMDGISAVRVVQFGQLEEVHDGGKNDIVELAKNPALPLGSPGRASPHFAAFVENIFLPQSLVFQVHRIIWEKEYRIASKGKA
jgi:hypothetical protein